MNSTHTAITLHATKAMGERKCTFRPECSGKGMPMESAKFIGTFLALPRATDFGLSLAQPNTLWQVWERADGTFWLNGLDNAGLQTKASYTIPAELLHSAFSALPQAATARPKLSAHSSSLLQHWFKRRNQANGTKLHQVSTPNLPDGEVPLDAANANHDPFPQAHTMEVHSHIGYANDEPDFVTSEFHSLVQGQAHLQMQPQIQFQLQPPSQLLMDNENFEPGHPAPQAATAHITGFIPLSSVTMPFSAEEGSTQPAHSTFPQPPVLAVSVDMTAQLAPSTQGTQHTAQGTAPASKSSLDNLNEGRRKVIEQAMRQEFALLLEHMQHENNAMTLRDMEELIRRQIPNSWQLKYMFSEFGLALRKEQQHQLALLCHQRALECSPGDANVLFNLARTEVELGAMGAAKTHLTQALEVAPDFTAAKNFLAFLSAR